jgi:hypothetical protein
MTKEKIDETRMKVDDWEYTFDKEMSDNDNNSCFDNDYKASLSGVSFAGSFSSCISGKVGNCPFRQLST